MTKRNSDSDRPMGQQPVKALPASQMMPRMPIAGDEPMGPPHQPTEPSRAESVQAAKARITRRQSLRKQRAAQSN